MRANIEIDVHSSESRGVSSFTISYLDKDPQTVASTANRLASLFIEENLKSREQQAKKTTKFLEGELTKLNIVLEEQERKLSEFKQQHLGSLPDQREPNLRMMDQLILQRQRIIDELNDAENRKILLQQFAQSGGALPPTSNDQRNVPAGSLPARIADTKRRLTQLQNKYTDSHPDVIAAKSELEKLIAQTHSSDDNEDLGKITSLPETETEQQILGLNLEIKKLRNEDSMTIEKMAEYQTRVEMAPKLEQQLASLSRDYENTKKAYDELMKKRLEADQAEKLEMNQQGEQFKVLDPAKVPLKPFKPNQLNLLLIGFMISLGLAGGLVFLLEYLDQSFYSIKDIESYLSLPVLASIPLVPAQESKKISLRYFLRYLPTLKRT
jgi:polysaccharide chain length determinant protein (PEP-CTERM system associated)